MASKTNCTKNGKEYYRISKVVGHKINAAGNEVPVRKEFYGERQKRNTVSTWQRRVRDLKATNSILELWPKTGSMSS